MTERSSPAQAETLSRETAVWDEIGMSYQYSIRAVDRLLREVKKERRQAILVDVR